jgi:hypothetical protein
MEGLRDKVRDSTPWGKLPGEPGLPCCSVRQGRWDSTPLGRLPEAPGHGTESSEQSRPPLACHVPNGKSWLLVPCAPCVNLGFICGGMVRMSVKKDGCNHITNGVIFRLMQPTMCSRRKTEPPEWFGGKLSCALRVDLPMCNVCGMWWVTVILAPPAFGRHAITSCSMASVQMGTPQCQLAWRAEA